MRNLRAAALGAAALALAVSAATGQVPTVPPYRPGFPVNLSNAGSVGPLAVGDLDNDGVKEIVAGTRGRRLAVINANGAIRAGWPQVLPAEANGIAIGLLDGDAFPDIVVSYKSTTDASGIGGVRAYRRDGSTIWTRAMLDIDPSDGLPDGVFSTPAIGDIDGVPGNEVAWGSFDMHIYVVRGSDGVNLSSNWPRFVRDTIWSSPALADLTGDGRLEIIIGVDTHAEGPPINTPNGGAIYVFEHNAILLPGFPRFFDETTMSSPAIGDVTGDSRPEIVVGGGVYWSTCCFPNVGKKVYVLNCDGSDAAGWPFATEGQVFDSPALANLEGDGKLEIVITDASPAVYALRGNGSQIFKTRPKSFFGTSPNAANPIVADITGDGQSEILVAVNTEIAVLSATGVQLTEDGPPQNPALPTYYMQTTTTHALATDLEGDGVLDIVAGSATPFPQATHGVVHVWVPGAPVGPLPWPAFHQDPALRRGVAPGTLTCAPPAPQGFFTLTPCRVADTRNPNGPLGGPAMTPMQQRNFPLAGTCGIPVTASSVALNVTVTGSTGSGDLRLFPAGGAAPGTSTLNWSAGQTRANNSIVALGSSGGVTVWCVMFAGSTHVILDVVGYFE